MIESAQSPMVCAADAAVIVIAIAVAILAVVLTVCIVVIVAGIDVIDRRIHGRRLSRNVMHAAHGDVPYSGNWVKEVTNRMVAR